MPDIGQATDIVREPIFRDLTRSEDVAQLLEFARDITQKVNLYQGVLFDVCTQLESLRSGVSGTGATIASIQAAIDAIVVDVAANAADIATNAAAIAANVAAIAAQQVILDDHEARLVAGGL